MRCLTIIISIEYRILVWYAVRGMTVHVLLVILCSGSSNWTSVINCSRFELADRQVEVVELEQRHVARPSTPSSQGSAGQRSHSPSSAQARHPYPHGISRGSTPSPGPHRYLSPNRVGQSEIFMCGRCQFLILRARSLPKFLHV